MHVPPLDTADGAYWYFMALLVGVTFAVALYVAGVAVGILPDPTQLF